MALPRVEVSIGITLNVGNYESVRADARFGMDAGSGTDIPLTWKVCQEEAKEGLAAALDGVEKMLAARKQPVPAPPTTRAPHGIKSVAGPRRAGR
jgi:hypothetical protein